jgi:hypothetical protein
MEQTYQLLNVILLIHIASDTGGDLHPSVVNQIRKFAEYLFLLYMVILVLITVNKDPP